MARIRSIVGGLFVLFLLYMAMGSSRVLTVRNSAGNTSPQWVTRTMVFQSKWLPAVANRDSIVHPDYPATPDTVVTDTNGTNFKYFPFISNQNATAQADSCRPGNTSYNNRMYFTSGSINRGGWPSGLYPLASGGSRYTACWFPIDKLPMDCTITSAKLCFYEASGSTITWGTGLGIYAVLDTLKKDERWLTNGNCTGISNPIARKASWDRRVPSGGGTDSTWVPRMHTNTAALGEGRDDDFDWGPVSKYTSANLTGGAAFSIDVTWPVQAYINRRLIGKAANAGFWIFGSHQTNGTAITLQCGPAATRQNNPFLVVSYIKKRYVGPWNGKPLAFVFATDDEDTCNIKFAAILDSLGYKHTMFVRGDAIANGQGKMTWAQIRTLRSTYGTDIEPHGLKHLSLGSIVGADSTNREISLTWLATGLGESDTTTTNFPVYAYPNGSHRNSSIGYLKAKGYLGARGASPMTVTSSVNPDTFRNSSRAMPWRVAGDSLRYLWTDKKSAMFAFAPIATGNDLWWFGATATTDSGATIPVGSWGYRERLDHMIDKAMYRGNAAMVVFVHGTKNNSTYPNEGVDYDELSYFMKRLKSRYGDMVWITTAKDLVRFYSSRGISTDPPDYTRSYVTDGIRAVNGWYKTKGDVR